MNDDLFVHGYDRGLLLYFEFKHLPVPLQEVSKRFAELAMHVANTTKPSVQRTMALQRLLEGKDAAVRAVLESQ